MIIDYEKIKMEFPKGAWIYAEQLNGIIIGKWDGRDFIFHEQPDEKYLLHLRVFGKSGEKEENRELKYTSTSEKPRDTFDYHKSNFIDELADAKYVMYGEQDELIIKDGKTFTKLSESRGGVLYFPVALAFPKDKNFPNGIITLMLDIKNFVRYNEVPFLPKCKDEKDYDFGLSKSGVGALEVIDYAYTGFYYTNGDEVAL
jgi:hypothetical protein